MKKNKILALVAVLAIGFTSCSSEETLLPEGQSSKLLKKYTLKRDATGAYSFDFDVAANAKVDKVVDVDKNINQYFLYSTDQPSTKIGTQNLLISDNELKISLVDTNVDDNKSITVQDDNISFLSKSRDKAKLADFNIQSNDDGTFKLDFQVKNNVDVSFIYNGEIEAYEIHLEDGAGAESSFSRVLQKEEGQELKIHFVNHYTNQNAKSAAESVIRKPVIIIDDGEDL